MRTRDDRLTAAVPDCTADPLPGVGDHARRREMTGATIGHYEIGEKLGAGAMGVVYRARDTRLRRPVALKFLPEELSRDPVARARFLREARAASALEHPNIATIYEIGDHEGGLFIAMALYDGETLLERMRRCPLSLEEIESIVRQLLEALAAAHAGGVVHRDLKPANVILVPVTDPAAASGEAVQVKVVDFGLAKVGRDGQESQTHLTEAGSLMGTVAYMSPEQARGEELDARTDLWAIGVIAYEMLAGKHPFAAPSSVGTLTLIATEEPAPLDRLRSDLPDRLRALVEGLLQKDLERRLSSAAEALGLFETDAPRVALRPRAHRRRWIWALAGAALVAAGALVGPRFLRDPGTGAEDSFVVLPCSVFGPAATELDYLAEAIPNNLTVALAQVEGLAGRRPPTSQEADDFDRLTRVYGVDHYAQCSVDAGRERIVLAVQLVDPSTREIHPLGEWDGTHDEYLELIRRAADEVRGHLLPGAERVAEVAGGAARSDAELAFQRGKYYERRYNNARRVQDRELATQAFEEALQLDPNHAAAAAELAMLALWSARVPDAEAWAKKALEIDETVGRAWTVRGLIEWWRLGRKKGTGYAIGVMRGLEYSLASVRHAERDGLAHWPLYSLLKLQSSPLALEAVRRATESDPLYAWGFIGEACAQFEQGEPERALGRLEPALQIDPDHYGANAYKTIFLATVGRAGEAREAFARIESAVGATPEYLLPHARFALELASASEAERPAIWAAFRDRRCHEFECVDETYRYLVPLLARHGAVDLALEILTEGAAFGVLPSYDWLTGHPDLEPLRGRPEFSDLAGRAREQQLQLYELLEAARRRGELPPYLESPLAKGRKALPAAS